MGHAESHWRGHLLGMRDRQVKPGLRPGRARSAADINTTWGTPKVTGAVTCWGRGIVKSSRVYGRAVVRTGSFDSTIPHLSTVPKVRDDRIIAQLEYSCVERLISNAIMYLVVDVG